MTMQRILDWLCFFVSCPKSDHLLLALKEGFVRYLIREIKYQIVLRCAANILGGVNARPVL